MLETTFDLKDGVLTVKPAGELDSLTAPTFEKEVHGHLTDVTAVILDFEDVKYISSAGLRVLLTIYRRLEDQDAEMKLINVNEHIMEILDLVGLLDMFTVE